jgi:hypothetical protein
VIASKFSKKLEEGLDNLIRDEAYITTFFPYSAEDLLQMFRSSSDDADQIVTDIYTKLAKKECIIPDLKKLTNINLTQFNHFTKFNDVCITQKILPFDYRKGQSKIARVIIFPHSQEENDIISDPLNTIFPILLHCDVPTYYTIADKLRNYGACSPDVTFIEYKDEREKNKFDNIVTLRFFEKAKTLVVSGVSCGKTLDEEPPRAIHELCKTWQGWCSGVGTHEECFTRFPMDKIKKQWGI